MDRKSRLRFRSDCGIVGKMRGVRSLALIIALAIASGIQAQTIYFYHLFFFSSEHT